LVSDITSAVESFYFAQKKSRKRFFRNTPPRKWQIPFNSEKLAELEVGPKRKKKAGAEK
jgi:hypothetical protein